MKNVRRRNRAKAMAVKSNIGYAIFVIVLIGLLFWKVAFGGIEDLAVDVHYDHRNDGGYVTDVTEDEVYYVEDPEEYELVSDCNITSADLDAYDESKVNWTEEDRDYLIKVLTGECQGMSYENQLKYGSVVLNRVASKEFPNTIKEVVLDKRHGIQYACAWDGNMYRTPTETTIRAAEYLLENGSVFPENVIYQAEFKQGSGVHEWVGNTYFCCR